MSVSLRARQIFAAAVLTMPLWTISASAEGYFDRFRRAPQNAECVLDNCADGKPGAASSPRPSDDRGDGYRGNRPRPRGASVGGDFDFYVFSLSWSSGFCATGGDDKGKRQCDVGSHLGFVVHGLWPQYERGFPSDCRSNGQPSRMALDAVRGLFPDEGLARYEWRKHGTCSGKSPQDYFADVRQAHDAIVIPANLKEPTQEQSLAPLDIQRAFIAANPRLRPGMLAVGCQRGVLQEVRICFSKDLREFRACPEVSRQSCRAQEISVPPVR
jgi:ribonuclease T2